MSLRTQLAALFAALTVVPLVAVGVIDYVRSIHALEDVIASQTSVITERAAADLADRYSGVSANLALLAENTAARQLMEHPSVVTTANDDSAASEYFKRLHDVTQEHFAWVVYRDTAGTVITTLSRDLSGAGRPATERIYVASLPIRGETGRMIGRVDAGVRLDSILPRVVLDARFGMSGRTAVLDTAGGDYVYLSAVGSTLPQPVHLPSPASSDTQSTRRISFSVADSAYVATLTLVPNTPFAIVSAGNVDEFSGPFGRIRRGNLAMVLVTTAVVATLFLILLWRATRSLSQLTLAADEVGKGNMSPHLPVARGDEVGRLSAAFALMISRVRETLAEVERSRKMAAIGEFASQISHEIRNPLTSIKLNLQTLERAAAEGGIREDLRNPVAISIREIHRLDRVVRGVLQLGRGKLAATSAFRLYDAATAAAASMQPALDRQRIQLSMSDDGNGRAMVGNRALVEGALMNLLVNATEAMPDGGTLRVIGDDAMHDGRRVSRIRVEDSGAGIAQSDRERVFTPFFSTKPQGTGLGLALAHRTVEEHAGRLWVEARGDGGPGAVFVMEFPTVPDAS